MLHDKYGRPLPKKGRRHKYKNKQFRQSHGQIPYQEPHGYALQSPGLTPYGPQAQGITPYGPQAQGLTPYGPQVQGSSPYDGYGNAQSPVPWKTVSFIGCVALYLVTVIALALPLGIISKNAVELIPPCTEVTMGSTMYFPELDNSLASPELAQKFCTDLASSFPQNISLNECGYDNDKCDVLKFRPGSLYIDFKWKATFKKTKEKVRQNEEKIIKSFQTALELAVYNGNKSPDPENTFKNKASPLNVEIANTESLAQCPSIYIPEGASVFSRNHGASYAGDQIQIRCDPGYRTPGDLTDQTLTCGATGTWNKKIVACEVQFCPEVTNMAHREILAGNATHSTFGCEILTKCQEGYSLDVSDHLNNFAVIKCEENGVWDKSLPACKALYCPDVTLAMNTSLTAGNLTDNIFSDTVTLECPEGLRFQSGATAQTWTCINTGKWNQEIEGCQYINGVWSTWTDWGDCLTDCSGEVINRTRVCDNPPGGVSEVQYLCDGDSIEYKNCTIDEKKCVSIFAAFTGKHESVASDTDIVFNKVLVDKTSHFSDGHFFTAPMTGEYLFSLSGGVINQPLKLQITKDDDSGICAIDVQTPRTDNYDIVSRNILIHLTEGTRIRVVLLNGKSTDGYGDQRLTSITIFSLSGLMKDGGVAFSAGFTAPDTDGILQNTGLFAGIGPQIDVPIGGSGFDPSDGSFHAPREGIYFFSVTVLGDKAPQILFDCMGVCENLNKDLKLRGLDYDDYTLSRSVLFRLADSDSVTPINTDGSNKEFIGSANIETSFSGFLYDPLGESVAFFAFLADLLMYGDVYGIISPVPFSHEIVNEGGDLRSNIFVCSVPGLYFFYFSEGTLKGGTFALGQFWLMHNDIEVAGLIHDEDKARGSVQGRSLILDLKSGDWVYLKSGEDIYLYTGGEEHGYVSFLGMLLQ